ncbi:4Fe-4S dicluster domain-containing protein [Kluyvera sp. STS39-E]|uniref:4Fe-4S dicluster domain-containing protein n=1 Tax=Kluyvera sp. STS39-E TaxID=3234748 RepID=UPI0034C61779
MSKSETYYQELMAHRHISRRGLFRAFVTAAGNAAPKVPAALPAHPLPPGALPDALFRQQCTRCDACINICPMGVLNKHEDGFPQLIIEYASCDGCGLCINACENKALRPQARFDTGLRPVFDRRCVSSLRACNQCVALCPEAACLIGESGAPEIDQERCNGCGECLVQCGQGAVSLELAG